MGVVARYMEKMVQDWEFRGKEDLLKRLEEQLVKRLDRLYKRAQGNEGAVEAVAEIAERIVKLNIRGMSSAHRDRLIEISKKGDVPLKKPG